MLCERRHILPIAITLYPESSLRRNSHKLILYAGLPTATLLLHLVYMPDLKEGDIMYKATDPKKMRTHKLREPDRQTVALGK